MADGYFIRLGDKTSCGGKVLEAHPGVSIMDIPHAREGDRVSCGKDGKVYRIMGGVWYIQSHGKCVAGTLDSISGCPCRAKLIPSWFGSSYESDSGAAGASKGSSSAAALPLAAGLAGTAPRPTPEAPPEEEEEEEEQEDAGIVLRLGLFFDGTGNNRSNSEAAAGCYAPDVGLTEEAAEDIRQRCAAYGYDGEGNSPDNSYGNDVSNVARLYELYPDQSDERLAPGVETAYLKVYLEGIGTMSGQTDSLYSQGTGLGSSGIVARVQQVPALVLRQLRTLQDNNPSLRIRRIEIDLFGFSRGAAAARHCANDLLKGADSLLAKAIPPGTDGLAESFAWRHRMDFALNFIGLFDTVPGIVAPLRGDFSAHNASNPGLDLRLALGSARKVVQLVAHHEFRHNFSLIATDQDIRLPGSHSDIGGGYLPRATEKVFLSRPDSSLARLDQADDESEAYRRTQQRLDRAWLAWELHAQQLDIETWTVNQPVRRGKDSQPPEKRVYAAVRSVRQVRGELSRVYLRIMRELAVRAGVAFDPIDPEDNRTALPTELVSIAAKLQAYALGEAALPLSEAEIRLLYNRYIHLSAHWNAAKGWDNSGLATVFVNRPTEDGKRAVYPNA